MSITGKLLYNKFQALRPDLSSGITPEILGKVCDDPNTQPFLEWFCKNVSPANILSNEEMRIKNILQDADLLLEGEALDAALFEATRDCPDLLHLVNLDDTFREDLFADYEDSKESIEIDEKYLQSLKRGIRNLKEIENELDDEIEEAGNTLDKERIEMEKAYDDCNVTVKEFDRDNYQFSKDVDVLLNVYVDVAKNQGNAVLWSQMPTDLFIKQVELYSHYLAIHIRKQFGSTNKEEQGKDSNYASLINSDREKQVDEKMHELHICKINLTYSKMEEINTTVQQESYIARLQYIDEIYNDGVLKIPSSDKMQEEILASTTKKDILEQNIELLRGQQFSEAIRFAEIEILKILKNDALARLERRQARLEKLKNLYSLARDHGHVYVDLLCTLMEMQGRTLHEIAEFIADARYYISTEYKLSSTRCEIMQQLQNEYVTLVTQSPGTCNAFNQIFISMMLGDDITNESLSSALKKYNDLLIENSEKKSILKIHLNNKIVELQNLEHNVNKNYMAEMESNSTNSLMPVPYKISTSHEEVSTNVQELQADVIRIRNQFKERMRTDIDLKRERDILWQRFLADPNTLRIKYEEAEQRANSSHFGDASGSKSTN